MTPPRTLLLLPLLGWACAGATTDADKDTDTDTEAAADTDTPSAVGVDPSLFVSSSVLTAATTEACTLSGGTQTTCYRITFTGVPDHEVGPFCPTHIDDDASQGGIWPESGELYDIDGDFIVGLAELYNDDNWLLYDPVTGEVNVTDTQASCEAAARPDVDPAYQNHCVECSLDYLGDTSFTVLLPVTPVPLSSPAEIDRRGKIGVALSGIPFDPPAPTEAILAAYTIAAFDDCGGHVNMATGYHYHAAMGCTAAPAGADGHAALLGYALDGYGLYAMEDVTGEPDDLDACRGHTDSARGYHYHAASPGENQFIGCFHGETGEVQ
jgi:hypothetical protein